jgi:hypothetical protein
VSHRTARPQRLQHLGFEREVLGDGHESALDVPACVVAFTDPVEQIVQLVHR